MHQKQLAVSHESQSESKVASDEGKTEEQNKTKDGGTGVNANTVVVSGKVNTGESSLVDKAEQILNLEKKELNEIKAVAEKEIEKVGGAGNVSFGLVGILDTKNTDEKKEEKKEDKAEQKENGEEKGDEKEEKENVTANANAESETEKVEEKEGEKNVTASETMVGGAEVKEEGKEKSEENEVEKVKSEEEYVTEHTPVVDNNGTSENRTSELADDTDEKLKVILTNEENNLNAILHKLDENNETVVEKIDKVEEEKHEIKNMLKELEAVKVELDVIDAVKKNKSLEKDDEEHKDSNVTIIDVMRNSPVLTAKLTPGVGVIMPKNGTSNVTVKEAMLPEIQQKVSIPPETNVKDLENEEKSLEVLRTLGQNTLPASNITQPKSNSEDKQLKADVVPKTAVTGGVNDIDAQEEKDEEERAKEMVEKFKEEEEKEQEKKENVMKSEINANVTDTENEKEEERKEQKKETITESKPVENMAVTTNKPPPVPAESKNNTLGK